MRTLFRSTPTLPLILIILFLSACAPLEIRSSAQRGQGLTARDNEPLAPVQTERQMVTVPLTKPEPPRPRNDPDPANSSQLPPTGAN